MVPDEHTGLPRQRDVWIETRIFGHFPVKVLVSCKHLGRVLNQQDIDHFNGELAGSGAPIGVIYSLNGFNEAAVKKARVLGISCCRIYRNEPADLPEVLIHSWHALMPALTVTVRLPIPQSLEAVTWDEFLQSKYNTERGEMSVIQILKFEIEEKYRAAAFSRGSASTGWSIQFNFPVDESDDALRIQFDGRWIVYQAKIEAHLVVGSYNVTASHFIGTQCTPPVDTQGENPGPGWVLLDPQPELIPSGSLIALFCDMARMLPKHFGRSRLSESKSDKTGHSLSAEA